MQGAGGDRGVEPFQGRPAQRYRNPRLKGILMELPIIQLYQGTWQFHGALEFIASAGFVPAQVHPVNYHSKDNVSLVEVDCLFRPRG